MPDYMLTHSVGVKDGTRVPPNRFDARSVGAKKKNVIASRVTGQAYAATDRLFLCSLKAGEQLTDIRVTSDTSFGTTTLSVGTTATPAKYANARTMTTVDTPTSIGPRATAADDGPLAADEDVWVTLGVGGIAAGVLFTFHAEITSVS